MFENKLTRRQALKVAGAAALGGLAATTFVGSRIARADHGEKVELKILMGEFFFQVEGQEKNAPIRIPAGKTIAFAFKNVGVVEHDARLGRGPFTSGGDFEGYNEYTAGGTDGSFMALRLEAGQEGELVFFIPEAKKGEWELGCFLPGHYAAGQKTTVIVE